MTQKTQEAGSPEPRPTVSGPEGGLPSTIHPRWWQRPWMIPLALSVLAVFAFIVPPYMNLNPSQATVPLPEEFPLKYPMLVLHIVFGSVALVAACLQVWPWLRQNHPAVHRLSGRIYVFGGVLPSVVLAWYLLVTAYGGPGWVGRTALSVLWFLATVMGFVMARRRRYAEHRRYMIYSFALTMEAFTTRLLFVVLLLAMGISPDDPPLEDAASFITAAEATAWCGWLLNLLIAFWWLERTGKSSRTPTGVGS